MGVTGWYYAGSLYLLATNRGRLLVTGADSGSRLIVHRGGETMALDLNGERRFTLPAGDYEAELEGDPEGLELLQEQFTVRRNQETQLEVRKEVAREILCLDGHKGPVQALAISPDCRYALSGSGQPSGDRTLLLWDLNTGQKVRQLGKTTTEVLAAAFMPDGIHAVSGARSRPSPLERPERGGDTQIRGTQGSGLRRGLLTRRRPFPELQRGQDRAALGPRDGQVPSYARGPHRASASGGVQSRWQDGSLR